jgi:phosphoinositide-3-kinase regulatory subunit 4
MGFPDDEIILLPLFRPFLRHDISRFKLKIPDGILSCVMPPLSSVKDLQYVERELERMRILLTEVFGPKAERYYRECLIGIKTYLEMLPQSMNINCLVSNRILNDSLDVLPRSIFSCCIPDQRYAESVAEPPPQWYVSVRKMLLSRSRLALERCFLKSTSTLSKVYGMNINKLAISNSFQRRWKGDVSDDELNLLSVEDSAFSEAQLDAYLSSIDSMLCENITSTGEWGSSALVDPACVENTLLYISKVLALELPPLPPRIGMRIVDDERRPQTNDQCGGHNPVYWRPKSDSLVGTSIPGCDHVGPVMKLAVPNDSAYFVSGGSDGRISIWESRQLLDNDGCLKSQVFYSHVSDKSSSSVRINDMCIIDNSNAVVSAGSDGSVNVYRIDCLSGHSKATSVNGECPVLNSARVSGSSLVRKIACTEGEIVAVSNYITPSGAIITFASQRGTIHSWDLRSEYEPFALNLYPELGLICSMAVGKDMHSILTGTKKGFLALWDIRFHKLVKLWKNSNDAPVLSLNTFINDFNQEYRPYVAMSCGKNEVSLFDLITGSPRFCLRSLDTSFQYLHQSEIPGHDSLPPILNEIEIPSEVKRYSHSILDYAPRTSSHDMVTSIIGNYNGTGQSHFLTGGSDGWIRFWDLSSLSKCSIVSGPPGYTRSVYESMELNTGCHTIICRQTSSTEGSMLSRIQQRGPTRPEQGHSGAVLDLAKLESPFPVLLSCSGDGSIKAWK